MAVYSINYNEGNKTDLGYKSVQIRYANLTKIKIFESGNFIKDWFDLIKFIVLELSDSELHFSGSSSVDHFFMDGANKLYDVAYLFNYDEYSDLKYNIIPEDELKFYVPKGTTPTWGELKKMCE